MSFFKMTRNITRGQVLSYMLMPQVMPRLNRFYQEGFANLAYLIALVYRAVNILPENHFVLRRENRQFLGLRQVLGAAASELQFSKNHMDKVIVYFVILVGMVLLAGQFFLTLAFVMVNPAMAQTMPTNYGQFFETPQYKTDIAYRLLWSVFGVPELFNQGVARSEFHVALHSLLQLYSVGLLVIAVIIVCYFIFAVVVETAQTGVPFGKRYNHVWTPIRLVFALGLLIPVGYGLNSAQWITLYSAKFGSDFATKGWNIFSDRMNTALVDGRNNGVGVPQAPDLTQLAANMMLVNGCVHAYGKSYSGANAKPMAMYLVRPASLGGGSQTAGSMRDFDQVRAYFNQGDINIRFGEWSTQLHAKEVGNVYPYCGEMTILSSDTREPGSKSIQEFYYNLVVDMYTSKYSLDTHGKNLVDRNWTIQAGRNPAALEPPSDYKKTLADNLKTDTEAAINAAVTAQAGSSTWDREESKRREYGWGGAGIWYNKIAQINGSLVSAVSAVPEMRKLPVVLEYVKTKKLQENTEQANVVTNLMLANSEIQFNSTNDTPIAESLIAITNYWSQEDADQSTLGSQTKVTGNVFMDVINLVFGTRGLFNMCANADIHPLAQLSVLGKGLIEATIRNLGGALLLSVGSVMGGAVGSAMSAASSILLSVGTITLTMGFMLFYVLPFLPFLYFFFAVGGWIKGLFEAMVGVPLWALAHLRIDGEGLPGDAATNGIYLIFEIFLRPILIIFGLLASVVIFAAMVKVLNEIFTLVVTNLSGHDATFKTLCGKPAAGAGPSASSAVQYFRGPIDELFFTILYAIIVYMIGMSCFKLIDLVPNNILRYMGASVPTFNDKQADAADGLMFTLSAATSQVSGKLIGGKDSILSGATGAITNTFKAGAQAVSPPTPPAGGGQGPAQ
jgi:conjugal transfer/type IV secretion protein DotA/TraY